MSISRSTLPHSAWAEVQQGIIDAEFLRAEDALVNKKYDEARKLWNEFLVKYPLDGRSARIMFAFGQMQFAEKKYDEAITPGRMLQPSTLARAKLARRSS